MLVHDLLEAGADPDLPNNKGWTALHQAAYADPGAVPTAALATLEILLDAGASPYAQAYGEAARRLASHCSGGTAHWRSGSHGRWSRRSACVLRRGSGGST